MSLDVAVFDEAMGQRCLAHTTFADKDNLCADAAPGGAVRPEAGFQQCFERSGKLLPVVHINVPPQGVRQSALLEKQWDEAAAGRWVAEKHRAALQPHPIRRQRRRRYAEHQRSRCLQPILDGEVYIVAGLMIHSSNQTRKPPAARNFWANCRARGLSEWLWLRKTSYENSFMTFPRTRNY